MAGPDRLSPQTRLSAGSLSIAGLGALTLTGALLVASRSEAVVPGESLSGPLEPPPRAAEREPGPTPISAFPAVTEAPERIEIRTTPASLSAPTSSPCDDTVLAQETFGRALTLLRCSNPAVLALSKQFLQEAAPPPTATASPEQQRIFLEASHELLAEALAAVTTELGSLEKRIPDAFVAAPGLPVDYTGTRFEVHPNQLGERRPMLVRYNGSTGIGYAIPQTEAGRMFALQTIIAEGQSADPAWFALLTLKQR